jgi:hypothetical protein
VAVLVAVRVAVGSSCVDVASGVEVRVAVRVGVLVIVGVFVCGRVPVGVTVSVGVLVAVSVIVGVAVSVGVCVRVCVGVDVSVGVFVAVFVAVRVAVLVEVFVGVLVAVFVAVLVGVPVTVGSSPMPSIGMSCCPTFIVSPSEVSAALSAACRLPVAPCAKHWKWTSMRTMSTSPASSPATWTVAIRCSAFAFPKLAGTVPKLSPLSF